MDCVEYDDMGLTGNMTKKEKTGVDIFMVPYMTGGNFVKS